AHQPISPSAHQPISPSAQDGKPSSILSFFLSKWKFLFYIVIPLLLPSNIISAQCLVHGVGTSNMTFQTNSSFSIVGQTFEACQTGEITSVSFGFSSGTLASTHNLRIGPSINTPTTTLGTGIYQTFSTSGGTENVIINLNTPFAVNAGTIYAVEFEAVPFNSIDIKYASSNDYPTGQYYDDDTGSVTSLDYDFGVTIQPSSTPTVPTLSEWGLIILALSFMTLGTLYLLQPKFRGGVFEQEG
ncbi:MAG: IPTL-CTERM sorting domain-containing protein, partial [Chitinophagales bacterium]